MDTITFEDLKTGKVKPEFGNPEHVKVVREYEKKMAVKKWEVDIDIRGSTTVIVEAETEEEARKLAPEYVDCSDCDIEINFVRRVNQGD